MSFNTAITGLKAASTMLDVTGNNIANVATTGFKSSRTEFSDIYATAVVGAGSSNTPGSGVTVSGISQDFSAGTIEFTNNNLDLAINGSGFFQLDDGQGSVTYTRAGAFELNKDGQIISKTGKFLQGYGLDAQGNRLPIGNLEVSQKESPPRATGNIDLAVNIDARADATRLLPVYNKDEPGSFTYTTTIRTFDSLGNEQSIKFNFAEQRPVREFFEFTLPTPTPPATANFQLSGVDLTAANLGSDGFDLNDPAIQAIAQQLAVADPRIDIPSVRVINDGAGNSILTFEVKSQYTNIGEFAVRDAATLPGGLLIPPSLTDERPANEVRTYDLVFTTAGSPPSPNVSGSITVGGVPVPITAGQTASEIALAIKNREPQILDRNPAIESVQVDTTLSPPRISLTFKADEGPISPNAFQPSIIAETGTITLGGTVSSGSTPTTVELWSDRVVGDNSFRGQYRLYGYLNNEELLDLGKVQSPGIGSETETGPVLISFNPSNGLLNGINVFGNSGQFTPGTQVPALVISGADPANPLTTIRMDLTNTTQFASASIVKNQQQNGFTKGDLIGVTFSPTGEMVASFSNGQNQSLGVVAFATFENQDGLQPAGDTEWIATLASGNAILNPPGTGLNGTLRSAALEQSNVDLSTELVNLIKAQRNFQASSKTLETANSITQTILNIRQ